MDISVPGVLKSRRRVSFSSLDQTSDFYMDDPPDAIKHILPSISGSSALGEMYLSKASLDPALPEREQKIFRLALSEEVEPEYSGQRRIDASFRRNDRDELSQNNNETIAVIHFGQKFQDKYCIEALTEPTELQVTINYSKKEQATTAPQSELSDEYCVDETDKIDDGDLDPAHCGDSRDIPPSSPSDTKGDYDDAIARQLGDIETKNPFASHFGEKAPPIEGIWPGPYEWGVKLQTIDSALSNIVEYRMLNRKRKRELQWLECSSASGSFWVRE